MTSNMIKLDRCAYLGWRIVRWQELTRCPESDAEWNELVEREDEEEAAAFAACDADHAACWALV